MNSTLVRIRVQTAPPLEPLKAWHAFSPDTSLRSICDLANDIVSTLGLGLTGDVSLELDGFVLLPSSPVGAVRDGDTITVLCKLHVEKRKAAEEKDPKVAQDIQLHKKQRTRSPQPQPVPAPPNKLPRPSTSLAPPPVARVTPTIPKPSLPESSSDDSSSDSSDSSSSESESDSDSGSDADSTSDDSDPDSDSDSSSDSGSAPVPQPIPRRPASVPLRKEIKTIPKFPLAPIKPSPLQPPVPPGHGKPSTKDRNARRRALRKHQAVGTLLPRAGSSAPSASASVPTSTPTVIPDAIVTTTTQPSAPISPAKNANKNKRRGFDKDMASSVATRVTFGDGPAPILAPTPNPVPTPTPTPPAAQTPKSRYTHYHVIPPSQRSDLPSNVIVTSVDVEAVDGMGDVGAWFEEDTGGSGVVKENAGEIALPITKVDWEVVDTDWEKRWDSFSGVGSEGWKELEAGRLVGWKALTLDPATCTPCTRIHVARIISKPDVSARKIECFVLERPGAGNVGFGFGGRFGGRFGGGEVEDEQMEEEEEVGEVSLATVDEMVGWKILS